ncbi:MAG: DMT family transporter, partial [Bacteroidaceae bacterium]|nr:DMT family transporter [Bacteroidaceae bacterium]
MNSKLLGHLACFIAYSIFGINIIVCKDLTSCHLISPMALFCLRSIGAGLLFWLISLFTPGEKVDRKDFLKIFFASVLGFFLTQITFLIAIPDITPMDCSIVSAISPILTMFIAAFALKEPIT